MQGARQPIIVPPDIPIVIPAGFWRESRPAHRSDNRVAGFPPEACGNDGMPPAVVLGRIKQPGLYTIWSSAIGVGRFSLPVWLCQVILGIMKENNL
jgi:hypothetical protein